MFRPRSHGVKCIRGAARLSIALLVTYSLLVAPAAVSVYGQSCEQGGSPLCGPSCSSYSYNILWDPNFDQTSCPAWEFFNGAERALTGTFCGGWGPPFARFNGPTYNGPWIRQITYGLSDPEWRFFRFAYTYEIDDPLNSPYTRLEVWIYAAGTWTLIDEATGAQWCNTRHIRLGEHQDWVGQPIWVVFSSTQPGNSKISFGVTALWQSRYND